ncbi:hypothetical protein IHE55_00595 [Streptomyces pactum]|uniref:Uncharacterized protein n=1 Tax=Streptomyces pactum TaxID=68249 RepID=A0ABS0NE12_9ACTN|nr:hypothetical protein [Streptomyces pactum]MBH5333379.1 hypothetical protein [Streptomyces pactum]
MTEPRIDDLAQALADRARPAVGVWNRLEGRPRTTDFTRALRAEVRDALWMVTRQWQLGEFRGSDAGSPVTATYSVAACPPDRFRPHGAAAGPLPRDRPLETVAERRPLPFAFGTDPIGFDLRLAIGRRWMKLLGGSAVLGNLVFDFRGQYVKRYPIAPPDPAKDADAPRVAHPEVWATLQAVAGRRMDGYLLYRHIKDGGRASDGINDLLHLHYPALDALGEDLVAWFDGLIDQPAGDTTWDPRRLEHRFSVAAAAPDGGEKVLTAQEYPGGELDWHAFSVDPGTPVGGTAPPPPPLNRTVFPAPVRYQGMPLPRWWALEDGGTNFAAVAPDSTDLARLIFLEFALVYSNDWYQLPCDLPAGTVARVQGLAVTDVFGQRLWITPAGTGSDEDWQRWSMFTLDTIGTEDVPADTGLFLPPGVPKVADGPPLEEVSLVRDENANLVWGLERTVRLATGEGHRGSELAAAIQAHHLRLHPPAPPDDPLAPVAYQAMNSVPQNWIPFIPVHVPGDNRSIQLQRAAMPHVVGSLPPVQPRTALLREGLDLPQPRGYFVNEEEVPQSGTRITVAYNRARWRDGRVSVWLAAHRGTGRGEGSSGLAFDLLIDTPGPER